MFLQMALLNCFYGFFCNSSIKDHWSQMTIMNIIIMKKFEILQELPEMWHKVMKWANRKMAAMELLDAGLPQAFNLQKAQFNLFLQSTMEWSTIKQGIPIFD